MKLKTNLTITFLLIYLGLFAQGKFYITPQVFAFVPSYKDADSVNKKQTLLKTKNFARKDFLVGINLSYYNPPFYYSVGIEQGTYSTAIYQKSDGVLRYKESNSALNVINYYFEVKYDLWQYNKKIPKKWRKIANPYLIVSKVSPYLGLDYLRTNKNIVEYGNSVLFGYQVGNTAVFDIPGTLNFYPNSRNNFGIRAGLDWTFYNGEKRKFILTFGYKFGFKKLGYYRYHFENQSRGIDFYYQTTTNGNGFSVKAGLPIKLFEINKTKAIQ